MFENAEQYLSLINAIPDIIFRSDQKGKILFINSAVEILGFSPKNLVGKNISLLFHKEETERIFSIAAHAGENNLSREPGTSFYDTDSGKIEVRLNVKKNRRTGDPLAEDELVFGELRFINSNAEDEIPAVSDLEYIGIIHDITRRKKAEDLLRKLLWAVDQTPLSIIITDENNVIEYINPQFIRTTGFSPQEVIGKKVRMLKSMYHPDEFYKQLNESLMQDGEWRGELVNKKKDGSFYWNALTISAVRNPGGNITNYISIQEDITEKKKAAKQLKILREKEILLREIHHRVKNNLQIIMSLVNLQMQSIEDEQFLDVFRKFENRIQSLALIHEKLYRSPDIARIEFGDYLRSLVFHIVQMHCADPEAIKITIICEKMYFDIDMAIPTGLILNEIVTNAVVHAFKKTKHGVITIKLKDREKHYFLEVADNGEGFPESVDTVSGGGLGMQLIRTLSDQLQGVLTLGSDNGSRVRISIPH